MPNVKWRYHIQEKKYVGKGNLFDPSSVHFESSFARKKDIKVIFGKILLKNIGGDYPPRSQDWGGRVPRVPPCGAAPARVHRIQFD